MDPIRSSLGAGVIATAVLTVYLYAADALFRTANLFVFATFTSLCAISGTIYCSPQSPMGAALPYLSFAVLFVIIWPLVFGVFTWGFPGESGLVHGAFFGFALWVGYAAIVFLRIQWEGETFSGNLLMLLVTVVAYLLYGLVLGEGYDYLAGHRRSSTERLAG